MIASRIFAVLDDNGDGVIEFDEFVHVSSVLLVSVISVTESMQTIQTMSDYADRSCFDVEERRGCRF